MDDEVIENQSVEQQELERRAIHALLTPAMSMAVRASAPLAWMKRAAETAYFREARRQGMSLREICALMDVSLSKVALLSRQLKQSFLDEDQEVALTRRIEYMLWARPLTLARLNQVLPGQGFNAIERALDELVEQGRVVRHGEGSFARHELIVREDGERAWVRWLARLAALERALRVVSPAVQAVLDEQDDAALASMKLSVEDARRLEALCDELSDRELGGGEDAVDVSIFWAPRRG